ncbi:hypothetical protein ACN9MU_29870 [Pseudoduganella sp. R-32]|uniref:hypothetical protein n=1 Tax=Pseudoduganella sp. R-32 TaxID=3404061 RepID=UPI003CF34301
MSLPSHYSLLPRRRGSGLECLTDSSEEAILTDMNDAGQLVGSSGAQPMIWQSGRQPITFDAGVHGGTAVSINNKGTIVAMARAVDGENGDQEQVVGLSRAGDHAGVWQDGAYHDLPDAGYSWARDINDKGWVAGGSGSDITEAHGAIWKGEVLETYGPGYATAINNAGVAFGYWEGTQHGMLFSGGQTYDLNTLWDRSGWDGWSLRYTEDINDAGEIVAIASNAATFAQQAALLSPVPELAPVLMLLAGLLLLGSLHRAMARNAIAPSRTI